ncbi:MAG: homoserine O-succinyltransferase [Methylococcaceae bacterium]|nr:homoserine O-succinyltransferase [Methylococcaceae bacterium]
MPLVAHTDLPTFKRLADEGENILPAKVAQHQDIRELHIGLLNIMPDAALQATERQFMRLVGACNQIAQFHVHLFTIEGLERGLETQAHIGEYYETFEQIKHDGLDALIISGANVTHAHLQDEPFWQPLTEVFEWARNNVTSTVCSCLATHALIQYLYGIERTRLPTGKRWGVFSHKVTNRDFPLHPLVAESNTRFDVPHSRFNEVFQEDMEQHGIKVLVKSEEAGVHLAVSEDGFRIVYFQGHPEYDDVSLLKEYKREVLMFFSGERENYPPIPMHYFCEAVIQKFNSYEQEVIQAKADNQTLPVFPEAEILPYIDNTWRDTAKAVFNNWLGKIYQITNQDRRIPFMKGVDPDNPLKL